MNFLTISNSRFVNCSNLTSVLLVKIQQLTNATISNSAFFNNTNGRSVITFYKSSSIFINSSVSHNNMAGVTAIQSHVVFFGRNVVQSNRYTRGAGITLSLPGVIVVVGKLYLLNNTAKHQGGAILVLPLSKLAVLHTQLSNTRCSLLLGKNSSVFFSGNTAGGGGNNLYGAILINCVVSVFLILIL